MTYERYPLAIEARTCGGHPPAVVFFFIAFHVIAFTRALMLEEYGIPTSTFVAVTMAR